MAKSVSVSELENRYKIPQDYLDKECIDENIKEIALLLNSWELLASHLGLSTQQIDAIKEDNSRNQEVKRKTALTKWKETFAFKATYRELLRALLNINRTDLACKVCELLVTPTQVGLQQIDSSETQSTIDGTTPMTSPSEVQPKSSAEQRKKFTTISEVERAFRKVVIDIEEYLTEKKVPLVRLQRYSCHLPVNLKGQFGQLFEGKTSQIWNAKNVGELFTILSNFWDYLHPDLLHYLVEQFAINEAVDIMSRYMKELSKFRKRVKISDYIGERRINLVDDDYTPIIAILGDEWCDKTLADLEEVRCDFSKKFSFLRLLPKMNGLRYNSIAVIFSVPKSVQFNSDELSEFFRSYNVLKLTVDDVCIYDDEAQQLQIPSSDCDQANRIPSDPMALVEGGEENDGHSDSQDQDSDDQNIGLQQSPNDIEVSCTHRNKGCTWTGELRQLEKHLNEHPRSDEELEGCLFTCVDCKFKSIGCEMKPARGDIPTHINDHSKIHLGLLHSSKSSLDVAFLEAQDQNAKLSQQVIGVNVKVAEIEEKHEREFSKLRRTTEEKHKHELSELASTTEQMTQLKMDSQYQELLAEMMAQQQQDLKQEHEQEIATLNTIIKELQYQVDTRPPSSFKTHQQNPIMLSIGAPSLPLTFTLTNLTAHKMNDIKVPSPPFYTHYHGYKISLFMYPNGQPKTCWHGSYISVHIFLMKGDYDEHLSWPFLGSIKISLLDQEYNKEHHVRIIPFNDNMPDEMSEAGRVTVQDTGCDDFMSHSDLQPKYLKNDCLVFEISIY